MNILSKLPFLNGEASDDVAAQAAEIQAKADRVAYHQAHVRNGPVSFKVMSNGQVRRAQRRDILGRQRKNRSRQIGKHFDERREAAVLRGHLQAVGILPFATPGRRVQFEAAESSLYWLARRHIAETGQPVINDREDLVAMLTSALNRYQRLTGQEITPLSPSYTVPSIVA